MHKLLPAAFLAFGLLAVVSALAPFRNAAAQRPTRNGVMLRNDGIELKTRSFSKPFTASIRPTLDAPASITVKTGSVLPITLKGSKESIIGTDDRVQVADTAAYPNSAIAYLIVQFPDGRAAARAG